MSLPTTTNERGKAGIDLREERESFLEKLPADWNKGEGYRVRVSPRSKWNIVELDPWADPRKTAEWAQEMMATIGVQRFQREYCRNWSLSTQVPFFPEYLAHGGDETFVRTFTNFGQSPLLMGMDFGGRRPALAVVQVNDRKTRLYCLREWMPQNLTAKAFMQVSAWLVGEWAEDKIEAEGLKYVLDLQRDAREGRGPTVPWFVGTRRVLRYSSHEALQTMQQVAREGEERRVTDLWEAAGMPLQLWTSGVEARVLVLRHLLRRPPPRNDPFFLVDKWCPLIREALNGGYTFKKPTRENPEPNKPNKDGYYENIMDALMYVTANVIDLKRSDVLAAGEVETKWWNPVVVEEPKALVYPKGYYSRDLEKAKDDTEGYSGAFDDSAIPGVYNREEGIE